jgi:hypothetical protein
MVIVILTEPILQSWHFADYVRGRERTVPSQSSCRALLMTLLAVVRIIRIPVRLSCGRSQLLPWFWRWLCGAAACLAAWSAASLPGTPLCAGIHWKSICIPRLVILRRSRRTLRRIYCLTCLRTVIKAL